MAKVTYLYVRLKPYNPKRGHVLRRLGFRGVRFYEGRWYKVREGLARELADLHQKHHNEDSPLAFDVATQKQARDIEEKERKKLEVEKRKLANAEVVGATEVRPSQVRGSLGSADLPENGKDDEDRELGASMKNTRDELVDVAESLGLEVGSSMTKQDILNLVEAEASEDATD